MFFHINGFWISMALVLFLYLFASLCFFIFRLRYRKEARGKDEEDNFDMLFMAIVLMPINFFTIILLFNRGGFRQGWWKKSFSFSEYSLKLKIMAITSMTINLMVTIFAGYVAFYSNWISVVIWGLWILVASSSLTGIIRDAKLPPDAFETFSGEDY